MAKLILGPVLSYRGGGADGAWRVSALVGVDDKTGVPSLNLDGRAVKPPVLLLQYGGRSYFRYDLTCKQGQEERRVDYHLEGIDGQWSFTVPGKGHAPRMAYVSCNGFSDPSGIRKLIFGA